MMKRFLSATAAALLLALGACEEEQVTEIDGDAAETEISDELDTAAEETEEAVDAVGDTAEEAADEAGDAAAEAEAEIKTE